jgi:hypothetical protein
MGGDVCPDSGQQGSESVPAGPALQGIADRLTQFAHGLGGDAVPEVGQVADVLIEGGSPDAKPLGDHPHGQLLEAGLVGQLGTRGDHVVTAQSGSWHSAPLLDGP